MTPVREEANPWPREAESEGAPMNRIVRLTDSNDTLADATAIDDWGVLLAFALAHPDADSAIDQMHRVAWVIVDHARAIQQREERAAALRSVM